MTPRPFRFAAQVQNAPSRAAWLAKVRTIESIGYSTVLMPDHFDDQLAPVPALMAAATATERLRVGSLVFDNDYKHPLVLAKEAATIDVLSEGRLELGIGAGWMKTDYEQSGMPYDSPGTRIARMEEGIAVMKGLFSDGPFSFSGEHYTVTAHEGTPKPVQRPWPPILVGGGGRKVLTIAGREADIVGINFAMVGGAVTPESLANGTAEATLERIGWIRDAAGDRFDDIELTVTIFVAVLTDDAKGLAGRLSGGFGMTTEQVLQAPNVVAGSVNSICEELQRRRELYGLSYIAFSGGSEERMAPVVERLTGT